MKAGLAIHVFKREKINWEKAILRSAWLLPPDGSAGMKIAFRFLLHLHIYLGTTQTDQINLHFKVLQGFITNSAYFYNIVFTNYLTRVNKLFS